MEDQIVSLPTGSRGTWNVNLTKLAEVAAKALEAEEKKGWTTDGGANVTIKVNDLLPLLRHAGWVGY